MDHLRQQFRIFLRATSDTRARHSLYEEVWVACQPRVAVFVRTMLKWRQGECEDVTQDIMLKVYNNLHRYNPLFSFTTWIYTIARNHCLDVLRRGKRIGVTTSVSLQTTRVQPTTPDADPEQLAIAGETHRRIQAYLDTLNDTDGQIAFLRFSENLGHRHIGRILGMPVGTIKYRVHVIREGLKRRLIEEERHHAARF